MWGEVSRMKVEDHAVIAEGRSQETKPDWRRFSLPRKDPDDSAVAQQSTFLIFCGLLSQPGAAQEDTGLRTGPGEICKRNPA